jgi:hypothetical protein
MHYPTWYKNLESAIMRPKKVALAVFLDIKGAFDNLTSNSISAGMNAHRVEEELTDWFCNYLNSRFCRIKGRKQYYRLVKGTGQGGVLSPTVWNFVMDSFLDTFATQEVDAIAYADDGPLIIVATDLEIARIKMQDTLHNAQA